MNVLRGCSFLWIDSRGSWHIINHAYNNYEFQQCGNSTLSAHFFSTDGKTWHNKGTRPCAEPSHACLPRSSWQLIC